MAQAMKIPMIAGAELDELDAATLNLTATMEKVLSRFDFVEFEKTRRAAIRTYSDMLAGMDIEIHPELLEVLNSWDRKIRYEKERRKKIKQKNRCWD